jgi:hypothetical protein
MFKFRKQKPFVLSQTNCVPLNAVMRVLKLKQLYSAPIVNRAEVILKDVTISIEAFSSVVDAEGGKVHMCVLTGRYESDGIMSTRVVSSFSAEIFVRLYEDGKTAPRIAYEGWHSLTCENSRYHVMFEAPDRFKFAYEKGNGELGSWVYSIDALRLDELPCEPVHARLYTARIRTLGHLKGWKRSQLLQATGDTAVVAGAEEILAKFGYQFKPE